MLWLLLQAVLSTTCPESTVQDPRTSQTFSLVLHYCRVVVGWQSCRELRLAGSPVTEWVSHCSFTSKIRVGKLPKYILDFLQCAWLLLSSRHVVCIRSNTGMNIYIYICHLYIEVCSSSTQQMPYGSLWPEWQLPPSTTYTVSARSPHKCFLHQDK